MVTTSSSLIIRSTDVPRFDSTGLPASPRQHVVIRLRVPEDEERSSPQWVAWAAANHLGHKALEAVSGPGLVLLW